MKPKLTPAQEDDCLARAEARRQGSTKFLMALYGVSKATLSRGIARARSRRKEKQR